MTGSKLMLTLITHHVILAVARRVMRASVPWEVKSISNAHTQCVWTQLSDPRLFHSKTFDLVTVKHTLVSLAIFLLKVFEIWQI